MQKADKNPDEPRLICTAIGKALGDFNVSEIARQTGLQRSSIYRAFGNAQLPNFSTVLTVLTAMGLQLRVVPGVIAKLSRLTRSVTRAFEGEHLLRCDRGRRLGYRLKSCCLEDGRTART